MPPTFQARKRGRGRPPAGSRPRKRQKRLDAIVDLPTPPSAPEPPRRSSRPRRAPQLLDSSPIPSLRTKRPKRSGSATKAKTKGKRWQNRKRDGLGKANEPDWAASEAEIEGSDGDNGVWRTRLRSSGGTKLEFDEKLDENEKISDLGVQGSSSRKRRSGRRRKEISSDEGHQDTIFIANNEEQGDEQEKEKAVVEVEVIPHSPVCPEPNNVFEIAEPEVGEEIDGVPLEEREEADLPIFEAPSEEVGADEKLDTPMVGDEFSTKALEGENVLRENNKALEVGDLLRENNPKPPISNGSVEMPRVKEGRRCGLCGGGVDGRPPKKLVQESTDSDNEAYEGSSASEEPNYDVWDGFGDEPGWLGRLLGPIHDRFGIARVWVHQHCAVWSPEVYFAGLGHLKNVRAALCRGRALKCSRCGRPGATIGCRVDRCPKTYHLPCSRADGCVFDHRKFLIACPDHRRLFQPQGDDYTQQIKRMKAKKLKLDVRKLSNDAMWKDLESEEKWLENRGEDEEFLKRESKRLHRDLIRIAPVYIGGSSENKLYQGWESVAGLQDVIQCMKEIVIIPLLYPEFFTNLSLTPPRGVLLHGYPGTGKTLVVRALIGACSRGDRRIAYFARKGADCLGKYVGDAERQLRLLFQVAERSQPSIIFFDEIDGLAPCRSRHQDQTHCSVVSTLLSLMDGLKSRGSVIVIGATNRPDAVDPALRRPGRFDREIYFPLPSVEDRSAILSLHTKSWPNPLSEPLLSWISIQTAGYAGADLQSLCTQAAINALKRHCALHEILSSTERVSGHGRLPSLPSFVVEERDWLSALAFAPPPCSRREAGMAANDIVSSPLSRHLIPCLLEPLSLLLISFGIDERVWLPPSISRASKSIKDVIFSNLQEKRITCGLWRLHLHDLIQDLCVSNELEKTLADCGLIADQSGLLNCYMSEGSEKSQNKFGSHEYHNKLQQTSGFRTLIAGAPRSGQHHLASCLLHAFVGHIEIQKVNLATISQEGHGDVIRGLTQILSKFLDVGRCVIYMPRIDLWAIDDNDDDTNVGKVVEDKLSEKSSKPSTTDVFGARKQTSEAWNSFVEQMDSLCTSSTIIILATCEVQNHDLPYGVRQFFCTDFLNNHSTPLEYSIPRFFVHVDGKYNHDIVLNSSAAEVSQDIVQHFVQLVHYKSHVISSFIKSNTSPTAMGGLEGNRENMENRRTTTVLDMSAVSEQLASKTQTSCRDNQTCQGANGDQRQLSLHTSHEKIDVQYHSHQELFQRTPIRFMKGGSSSAIAMFGYQILRYPQFAELCWVTSKLKDGPCSGINGPWKGWPFNSCVMHLSKSPSKVVTGGNSNTLKDKDSGIVRGLTAVGLLAFKGVYTSVGEVSLEVREVLELLVERIHAKILDGKDRYRYFRLLSQVAYLEDLVNNWAYTFHSSQADNQLTASNTKRSSLESHLKDDNATSSANPSILATDSKADNAASTTKPSIMKSKSKDDNSSGCSDADINLCMQGVSEKSCNEVQDKPNGGNTFATNTGGYINFSKGLDSSLLDSDRSVIPEVRGFHDPSPFSSLSANLYSNSSLHRTASVREGDSFLSEVVTPLEKQDHATEPIGSGLPETNIPSDTTMLNFDSSVLIPKACRDVDDDLKNVPSSCNAAYNSDEAVPSCDLILRKMKDLPDSEISCLYGCCSQCMHTLLMLIRDMLSDQWISTGCQLTVDDIHDAVASCSSNLLRKIRSYFDRLSSSTSVEHCFGRRECRTEPENCAWLEIGNHSPKGKLFQHNSSRKIQLLATECNYHQRNLEDIEKAPDKSGCLCQPPVKFFFRGGVLLPASPPEGAKFHCKHENLCICLIVEIILMFKQSSNRTCTYGA